LDGSRGGPKVEGLIGGLSYLLGGGAA
jgi:hypothetical protein